MKRFVQLLAAVALSIGAALFGASSAHAQPIDCSAHLLDKTNAQGIWFDTLQPSIKKLQKVYADADVYIQAYEHFPGGGTASEFVELSKQCSNWYAPGSNVPRYNVIVIAYSRGIDDIDVQRGNAFGLTMNYYQLENSMKAVRMGLGPETSQVDPSYITSAFGHALRDAHYFITGQRSYFHDGVYSPPAEVGITGHENNDPKQIAGIIFCVVVGFLAAGIVLTFVEPPIRRYLTGTSGPPTI